MIVFVNATQLQKHLKLVHLKKRNILLNYFRFMILNVGSVFVIATYLFSVNRSEQKINAISKPEIP